MTNKTIVLSSRVVHNVYHKLECISKKKKIAISTVINQILTRYTVFVHPRLECGDILFPKSLLIDFLKFVPREKYGEIASKYVQENTRCLESQHEKMDFTLIDREYRNFHEYNSLNLTVFEHSGYNVYKIYHKNGLPFSEFFFQLSKKFFEYSKFNVTDSKITDDEYGFTVIF